MIKDKKNVWSYIRGYKFNSLLFINFVWVFVLVTLPLLLVVTLNYNKFNAEINQRMMDMNEGLLQKSAVVTDNIMIDVLSILDKLSQLDCILDVVSAEKVDADYYEKLDNTINLIREHTLTNNFIVSSYVYSDVNQMLITNKGVKNIKNVRSKEKWYYIHRNVPMDVPYLLVNHTNSIFLCQSILDEEGEKAGILVLDMELQKIKDLLEREEGSQQGAFFVVDISGQIMYSNAPEYLSLSEETRRDYRNAIVRVKPGESMMVKDNGSKIISVMESVHNSWRYALVTELPAYEQEAKIVRDFLVSSLVVGVITSIIAVCIITCISYRPMKKIINVIENPHLHWNEYEASKESNELLYITSNILDTLNKKEEMSQELESRIRALRQAQFRALQFQVDPHFLFNTLETIKWNAVQDMGLGNSTSKMLTKLAKLYRIGLENDDVIVPLKEELEFLKLYIDVLRFRFGDAIRFRWEIDESLHDCSIIKMCLQPLVENAINHGLRPRSYHGNITISAYREGERLCISVTNDGEGMSNKDIRSLNEKLKTGVGFEDNKVGLRNVNERIKLIYGKEYGVTISSTIQEANKDFCEAEQMIDTHVVITFPYRE